MKNIRVYKHAYIVILGILGVLAVSLTYLAIINSDSDLTVTLYCEQNGLVVRIENYGNPTRIFSISIAEGDKIILLKWIGTTIGGGQRLDIPITVPGSNGGDIKVSLTSDSRVISGLKCNPP